MAKLDNGTIRCEFVTCGFHKFNVEIKPPLPTFVQVSIDDEPAVFVAGESEGRPVYIETHVRD